MRILRCISLALFLVTTGLAQLAPVREASPRIEIDVAALDAAGGFNTTLKASDFNVLVGGTKQNITEFTTPDDGANVLLLFDHTSTWLLEDTPANTSRLWKLMEQGVAQFLNSLAPKDRISIAAFEAKVSPILPWRPVVSRQPITANLSEITARPLAGKDIYGALNWAAAAHFNGSKGRKVVIVFTDGRDARLMPRWFQTEDGHEVLDPLAGLGDDGEAEDLQETLSAVRNSGVQFYFLAPFPDRNARFVGPGGMDYTLNGISGNSSLAAAYLRKVRSRMDQIAQASASRIFFIDQPADAPALYAQLPEMIALRQTYHLVVSPDSRPVEGQRIEVRIRNGELRAAQSRQVF